MLSVPSGVRATRDGHYQITITLDNGPVELIAGTRGWIKIHFAMPMASTAAESERKVNFVEIDGHVLEDGRVQVLV